MISDITQRTKKEITMKSLLLPPPPCFFGLPSVRAVLSHGGYVGDNLGVLHCRSLRTYNHFTKRAVIFQCCVYYLFAIMPWWRRQRQREGTWWWWCWSMDDDTFLRTSRNGALRVLLAIYILRGSISGNTETRSLWSGLLFPLEWHTHSFEKNSFLFGGTFVKYIKGMKLTSF